MSHDNYDDGLVHSHRWATEPPTTFATTRDPGATVVQPADRHDDGLIHSHGWACSERGRMARG
jgi:hypothetical protein